MKAVNIACGSVYVSGWCNFDYDPHSTNVDYANLLERIPLPDNMADIVYSSHFIEHIPRDRVFFFVSECYRVVKPGGVLRLVLPDWEELCNSYLAFRREGIHDKADFLMIEMLDQCVRKYSGGELGRLYRKIKESPELYKDIAELVLQRTGDGLDCERSSKDNNSRDGIKWILRKIYSKLARAYCRMMISLTPSAFREQNVSFAHVGELHSWMYDFYSIEQLLNRVGFVSVERQSATTSIFPNFPFYPLDIANDGRPRKGLESMYIEAIKP